MVRVVSTKQLVIYIWKLPKKDADKIHCNQFPAGGRTQTGDDSKGIPLKCSYTPGKPIWLAAQRPVLIGATSSKGGFSSQSC